MTALDALQSVQFITAQGKRLAVISAEDWETLIEWIETIGDTAIADQAFAQLKAAGGDRAKAGWHEWSAVEGDLA